MSLDNRLVKMPKHVARVVSTFDTFFKSQSAGGVILLICLVIALLWANSKYNHLYFDLIDAYSGIQVGSFELKKNLGMWINEGLMTFFFLLAGLEIKREILGGELGSLKKAALPVICAISGMVFPAIIFVFINWNQASIVGWAVPMATDIAFALGILSMFGNKIPRPLIVLFSAAVIVDDLGAVIVIAIFYNSSIGYSYLVMALLIYLLLIICNRAKVRNLLPYGILGVVLWFCLLKAGLHATIAGVLVAFVIPGRNCYQAGTLYKRLNKLMRKYKGLLSFKDQKMLEKNDFMEFENESENAIVQSIENAVYHFETPLHRLEHRLHKFITFVVVPLFVLFNAGIIISTEAFHKALYEPMVWGIVLGLLLGKIIGLSLLPYVLTKFKWVKLPDRVRPADFIPLGILSGMGFTMSIFIAELAFGENDQWLMSAKLAILLSSILCGILGYVALYIRFGRKINDN